MHTAHINRRTHRAQPDLVQQETPPDLFGAEARSVYRPDPEKVRSRLDRILAEARAALTCPWESPQLALYRQIFPQMTLFLPEEEGARYRLAFETEIARLLPG